MANKIDVLLDKKAGNLSICTIDDTTCVEVETTLSVAEAWTLVTELNSAIQKLTIANETRIQVVGNAKLNKDQLDELEKALEKSNKAFDIDLYRINGDSGITVHVDARGATDSAQVEESVRRAIAQAAPNFTKTNAVSTTPVPKSTHRPYSGTMND